MQKPKQDKVLLKCICKGCPNKVVVSLKTMDAKDTAIQFFNLCYQHRKQFNNKTKELTASTGKKEIEKIIQTDIVKNISHKK